jgi:hypothetical protein
MDTTSIDARWGMDVRWGRERGVLQLTDPFSREVIEVDMRALPRGVRWEKARWPEPASASRRRQDEEEADEDLCPAGDANLTLIPRDGLVLDVRRWMVRRAFETREAERRWLQEQEAPSA